MNNSTNHALPYTATAKHPRTSATDAAVACSRLPVLARYRTNVALWIGILVTIGNLVALIGLTYYFRNSCDIQYGTVPNEDDAKDTPPALATLADQPGVTIRRRTLVYFKDDESFPQLGSTYWQPAEWTCGCAECDLASCVATIPINVEYEQCHPWLEAFSLATALLVYVHLVCTVALVGLLACLWRTCGKDNIPEEEKPRCWDYVKMLVGE